MAYKNILVYVDGDDGCVARLNLACQISNQFDAKLTGMHVVPQGVYTPYSALEFPLEVYKDMQDQEDKLLKKMAGLFNDAVNKNKVKNHAWRFPKSSRHSVQDIFIRHANYQGLIIISQEMHMANNADSFSASDIIMGVGCPAIVTPNGLKMNDALPFDRVTVAWNGSRESARALHDARPILQKASDVQILMANLSDEKITHDDISHEDEMQNYLKSHNIDASIHHVYERKSRSITDLIFNAINDNKSDLLVMGGYGHSRLAEMLFKGVTYQILQTTPVPVFISH